MTSSFRNRRGYAALCAVLLACLSGCAQGSFLTAGAGPQFDQNGTAGVSVFAEASWALHEPKPERAEPTPFPGAPERAGDPDNRMGIALVGGVQGGWVGDGIGLGFVAFDYLPFLYDGAFVNFGGGAGFGWVDGEAKVVGVAPRLGFGVTPWKHGSARWGLGGRLNMQFTTDGVFAGPAVTVSRVQRGE